ncbi:MAG: DUF2007 domain-containing protein [Xanthomonadales bacterium]|nr:DUF2007 domain-containing protein [Xanthomonadales bacterium]
MIKVFEDFDLSTVGRYQSVLESEGIRTYLKNQFTASVLGEIPFVEAIPQLWILEDEDLPQANALIRKLAEAGDETGPDWTCPHCRAEVESVFDRCWNCERPRPTPKEANA